jgi:uncharacterized OB-fold protein
MEQIKKRIVEIIENSFTTKEASDEIVKELFYKNCKQCGTSFLPYNKHQVFCSRECRYDWHFVNKGFDIEIYKKHQVSKKFKK